MKRKIYFLLLSCWHLLPLAVSGQTPQEPRLTIKLESARFSDFIRLLESQTDYYFYYDPARFDSLSLDLDVADLTFTEVLDVVFKGSEFEYAVDKNKRVFITEGQAVITRLSKNLFNPNAPQDEDPVIYTGVDQAATEKLLSAAESKLYEIGVRTHRVVQGNSSISGYVRNAVNGEPVIGAALFIEKPMIGTTTDELGYFKLTIPRGKHQVKVKSFGMRETSRNIFLYSDGKLDIEMVESVIALREVAVKAGVDQNVTGTQMGQVKLTLKNIKQMPAVLGETDLLRSILTLPGVKSVGENSTGLNVRGGSADQNLIQYNDAVIYNPSHLFGFFSAFNPDVLRDVELYKSTIPSKYGGRLASVLDINGRDGNKKKFVASGGIGFVTGRLTLEGPIIKDKTSFLLGGRSTYSNWVIKALDNPAYNQSKANFYDVNLQIAHEINEKNSITLTGYTSDDRFKLYGDTLYAYQNRLGSIKWKHNFSQKLYSEFTASHSQYRYQMHAAGLPLNAYDLQFGINQSNFKADLSYALHPKHILDFGVSSIYYKLQPGIFRPKGELSLIMADVLEPEQALESAVYIEDKFDVSPKLSVTGGIRYSFFQYLGPKTVNQYVAGFPVRTSYQDGTLTYSAGETVQQYGGPEIRLSARYNLQSNTSLKVSYNTLRQYIHLLSNTMTISPTDIWKLSDKYIKPQTGDQISLGIYKNLKGNQIEVSVEGYYKNIDDYLDYRGVDSLIMNHNKETAVMATKAKAYGVELLLKKMTGKLNGWVGYTYSRTLLQAKDPNDPDAPNSGDPYPSNFDKPHDFTAITNYRLSHRFSLSLNFVYSTGRPYTPPIGKYIIEGAERIYYAERNQNRIPDYYRVDFSMNIEGNHKVRKLAHSSWSVSVYNLLGRKNPTSVYFQSNAGRVNGYQLSIFGQPIPTITYNFRF